MPQTTAKNKPEQVDAYLMQVPSPQREALQSVRAQILSVAPEVAQRVAYGIPIFSLRRDFLAMGYFKHHLSLVVMDKSLLRDLAEELHGFEIVGTTIHFTPDQQLPVQVLTKIIKARILSTN